METQYKNHNMNLTTKPRQSKLRHSKPLLDFNIEVLEVNEDIEFNIRADKTQVIDALNYFLVKSFKEQFRFVNLDIENPVKELSTDTVIYIPVSGIDNKYGLTIREIEIMEKVSKGMLNKEISDNLDLCINTVKSHLKNIFRKLGVHNRSEATVEYLKMKGIIKNPSAGE